MALYVHNLAKSPTLSANSAMFAGEITLNPHPLAFVGEIQLFVASMVFNGHFDS